MTATAPATLWLVRHGQSAGNVLAEAAEREGRDLIDISDRDMDVDLSPLGERQARALGRRLAELQADQRPDVIFTSPYVRAERTAQLALESSGWRGIDIVLDERLRERELGVADLHTQRGIRSLQPEEYARRQRLGKMYYRPPGGESWADVALRVRSVMDSMALQYPDGRVLVVAHEVVVLLFRYLLDRMVEADLLALNRDERVANCSLTTYAADADGHLVLVSFNAVEHLAGVEAVTAESDAHVGAR